MYKPKKKFFTESRIEKLVRFWFAGSVFYFIGWGTSLGRDSTLDFVFILIVGTFVVESFLVGPIIRMALNVQGTRRHFDDKLLTRVVRRLFSFLKTSLIIVLIYFTYSIINLAAIAIFGLDSETIILPAEPMIFGLLYVLYFNLIKGLTDNIKKDNKKSRIVSHPHN